MLVKIKSFIKKEAVFCISAFFAVITMFFVPPSKEYIEYIDFRVICLLFCLMAVVAGFKSAGIFDRLTYVLLKKIRNARSLGFALVMLPFFSSMLVTNDVALLIFIPFTITLLCDLGREKAVVPVIVLQTVGANLGSMATPVGNPQNLFLYSKYTLTIGEFFSSVLPLTAVSFVVLGVAALFVIPKELKEKQMVALPIKSKMVLFIYTLLFVLCLLTVFRVVPFVITTVIIAVAFLVIDKKLLKDVDYMLLLTFVCFFIISENLGRVEAVRNLLQNILEKSVIFTSVGASQIISNVPAAVLLSGFTDDWHSLLLGTNIGGLGTPVASLASLITLKLYMKTEKTEVLKFLFVFILANLAGLFILIAFSLLVL